MIVETKEISSTRFRDLWVTRIEQLCSSSFYLAVINSLCNLVEIIGALRHTLSAALQIIFTLQTTTTSSLVDKLNIFGGDDHRRVLFTV